MVQVFGHFVTIRTAVVHLGTGVHIAPVDGDLYYSANSQKFTIFNINAQKPTIHSINETMLFVLNFRENAL